MPRTIPPKGAITMQAIPNKKNRQVTAFTFVPEVAEKHKQFQMNHNPVTVYDKNHPDFHIIASQVTPIHLINTSYSRMPINSDQIHGAY